MCSLFWQNWMFLHCCVLLIFHFRRCRWDVGLSQYKSNIFWTPVWLSRWMKFVELVYLAVTRGQHNRLVQIMSFISFHSGGPAYVLNSQADADGPWAVVWTFILANFHSQNYTACPWPLKMFPPERGAVSLVNCTGITIHRVKEWLKLKGIWYKKVTSQVKKWSS